MERGNIPGFYYDQHKRKYFKIVPNHAATPASSQYSKENISKAQRELESTRAQQRRAKAVQQELVRPAVAFRSPLVAEVGLNRELSQRLSLSRLLNIKAKAYASGLETTWEAKSLPVITSFAHDPGTNELLVGSTSAQGHPTVNVYSSSKPPTPVTPELRAVFASEISSISLSSTRVASITCLGDGNGPAQATFMSLMEPEFTNGRSIDYQMSVIFTFAAEITAWTSVANPFLEQDSVFAVGLSDSTILYTDVEGGWDSSQKLPSTSDVFALAWLTPHVVSIGHRNGTVKLWDVRARDSSLRLQHPSSITAIRCFNENLVISGHESSLAMYDLRMPLESDAAPPNKRRKRSSLQSGVMRVTAPALRFDYENDTFTPLGFDIDADKGLVAAGNGRNSLSLYSLTTGEKIRDIASTADDTSGPASEAITGLQFCRGDLGQDAVIGSRRTSLFRLTW